MIEAPSAGRACRCAHLIQRTSKSGGGGVALLEQYEADQAEHATDDEVAGVDRLFPTHPEFEQRLEATHEANQQDYQREDPENEGDHAEDQTAGGIDDFARGLTPNSVDHTDNSVCCFGCPVRIGQRIGRHLDEVSRDGGDQPQRGGSGQ